MSEVLKDYGRKREDPASKALENYAIKSAPSKVLDWMGLGKGQTVMTTSNGAPISNRRDVITAGRRGPLVVEDVVFFDEWQHFNREKIPERIVHAKGTGAHGYFEVTQDITKYSRAAIFNEIGKKTPLFIRFSQVIPESGSPDTVRDPRGFAIKFYTEEGNWDLVANNTPIFFTRDPMTFISFIHSQKRNPVTHLKDANMQWDFLALRPESTHQIMYMFGDRGIPANYRTMNGYGSNTYKLINGENQAVYCKFHVKCQQVRNLLPEDAQLLAGMDPDYYIRDLYNAIEEGNYPEWTMYIQVMTFEEAENWKFDPFDVTKVWPHDEYPLIEVGKIVLNRNPKNYFAEVEQAAFAVANVVPGIGFSPDKMLQGRIFAYKDTQLHRLGKNFMKLPINCPYRTKVATYQIDGESVHDDNNDGAPAYYPNSFMGPIESDIPEHVWPVVGDCKRYEDLTEEKDYDNFTQPGIFWNKVLDPPARKRLVQNIVVSLKDCKSFIIDRAISNFTKVDPEFGRMIREGIDANYDVIKDVQPELSEKLKV